MEPLDILRADPLDLLFENRNKLYGAYTLRKFYNQRLHISLAVIFSVVILSSFLMYVNFHSLPAFTSPPLVRDWVLEPAPEKPAAPVKPVIPPARTAAPKPPSTVAYTVPVIVDQQTPKPMASMEDLQQQAIDSKTVAGPPDNGEQSLHGTSAGSTTGQNDGPADGSNEVFDRADVMPEFPGGIEALKRFLLKNLRMPENSLEEGSQVKVIARFVVGADGRVRDVEITQAAGARFDAEVRRVISKMPDWKPGVQNHRTVSVYFSLPVNFVTEPN
jgi:protein TonB